MTHTYVNHVGKKLAQGTPVFGISVRAMRTPDIARIARQTGHDFLFLDTQHAIFGLETISAIAQTAIELGVSPLVRCRGLDDPDASLLLDNGVQGIIFPDVVTADDASRAVDICKFAPIGRRSVAGGYMMFNFAPMPVHEAAEILNGATLVGVMIETVAGLENVEAIAAVPGVDLVLMGTNDLLVDMGIPGEFDAPDIGTAQDRLIAACAAAGVTAGIGGNRSIARQAKAIRDGARFLTTQTDLSFLGDAAREWVTELQREVEANDVPQS